MTLNKIEKYYDEGRLLIIAFYGCYSNEVFDLAENFKESLDKNASNKIYFVDIIHLAKLFSANE